MKRKNYNLNIDMPQLLIFAGVIALTVGVCAGAIFAGTLESAVFSKITENIRVNAENGRGHSPSDIFRESAYKYGKYTVFIWLFGFVPYGAAVSLLLLFVKGASLGFTSGILLSEFGIAGISRIAELYLLQNLILIPAYLFTAYYSIAFAMKKKGRISDIPEYSLVLAVGGAAVVIACLMETFFVR